MREAKLGKYRGKFCVIYYEGGQRFRHSLGTTDHGLAKTRLGAFLSHLKSQARDKKVVEHRPEMCIGCGVCVYKCPTQSLRLSRRETEEDIPSNMSEAGYRFLSERGRDLSRLF